MIKNIEILKGVHPGIVLERELQKRNLSKGRFALTINEYPQTIGAITKGKRDMNTSLSLKIEEALGMDEGYLMTLQVYYDIKKIKQQTGENNHPDLSLIRRAIFWDTSMDKIDWSKQKKAVIKRVFERGNEQEKKEIIRFYGKEVVDEIINKSESNNNSSMSLHKQISK
jgi:addiction module HigA family antidote